MELYLSIPLSEHTLYSLSPTTPYHYFLLSPGLPIQCTRLYHTLSLPTLCAPLLGPVFRSVPIMNLNCQPHLNEIGSSDPARSVAIPRSHLTLDA